MTILAAASSVEIRFAGLAVAGKQLFDGISFGDAGGVHRFRRPCVQKRRNVRDLLIRQGHCGHALVRAPVTYDFADQIALYVVRYQRRAHQVRSACSRGVRPMAEPARLFELFAPALGCRILRSILRSSPPIRRTDEDSDHYPNYNGSNQMYS